MYAETTKRLEWIPRHKIRRIMLKCQRCLSERVLETNAYAKDCQNYILGNYERGPDYAPEIDGICNGDYLCPDICLDCGQTQGVFPKPRNEMDDGLSDLETDNLLQ